jgi:hypothetical protein
MTVAEPERGENRKIDLGKIIREDTTDFFFPIVVAVRAIRQLGSKRKKHTSTPA